MPAGNYERDAVSGTEYGPGYVQEHVCTIVAAASASANVTELKARKAPRGRDGGIAFLATRAAASSSTCPSVLMFMWIDDSTATDDGANVLIPTDAGAAWVALTAYSTLGTVVNNAGNEYVCVGTGTSGNTGGPTATTSALITDGTVTWQYRGAARWGRWMLVGTLT